jgi:hypothetical protein
MKAVIQKTSQEVQFINDPRQVAAAETDELMVGKKPILITKGGDIMQVCCQIYVRFSKEKDSMGNPFTFSRKFRSLAHTSPVWHSREKVSGSQFEQYLTDYFQFAERVTNNNGPALILTDTLPKFFSALVMQTRFTAKFVELFEIVD